MIEKGHMLYDMAIQEQARMNRKREENSRRFAVLDEMVGRTSGNLGYWNLTWSRCGNHIVNYKKQVRGLNNLWALGFTEARKQGITGEMRVGSEVWMWVHAWVLSKKEEMQENVCGPQDVEVC